jgi:hypothetical protein
MITFEDKEDIRSSNLPRKNRITADDINQLKAHANRVQVFDAIIDYDEVQIVAVNDIGSVPIVSNPSANVVVLAFPANTFLNKIVIVHATSGEQGIIERAAYLGDLESIEIIQVAGANLVGAYITIKSYPAP